MVVNNQQMQMGEDRPVDIKNFIDMAEINLSETIVGNRVKRSEGLFFKTSYLIHKIIVNKLFGTLHNKKIAVLGFAFKANTNDTRESPAIEIVKNLIEENAKVYIYDPKVTKKKIEEDLNKNIENNKLKHNCFFCEKIEETFINADAILITTEWEDFKKINWLKVATLMRKPSWIFDTRSIVNKSDLKKSGINLWKLGYGLNS